MEYQHATVVRLATDDPHNGIEEGKIRLVAGKHEGGYSYRVPDGEERVEIECETLGVVGPADRSMGEQQIVAWAADQDEAEDIAAEATE